MKTLLSLLKRIKTPLFIGFFVSTLIHASIVLSVLNVFSNTESIAQNGDQTINMSLASFDTGASTKQHTTKPQPKNKPKPDNKAPSKDKQEITQEQTIVAKETKEDKEESSNQTSEGSTYESLAYNEGVSDEFLLAVQAEIAKKHYAPQAALSRAMHGIVVVEFVLLDDGRLEALKVHSSNAGNLLNKHALLTIKAAHKKFPKPQKAVRLKVPLEYNITNS